MTKNFSGEITAQKPEVQSEFNNIITKIGAISVDLIKYHLKKRGYVVLDEGITLQEVFGNDKVLRITFPNGNWMNVVKNHSAGSRSNWGYIKEQVRQIMCTHYNVPNPKYFDTFNDWAEDLLEYGFCNSEKREAKVIAEGGWSSFQYSPEFEEVAR